MTTLLLERWGGKPTAVGKVKDNAAAEKMFKEYGIKWTKKETQQNNDVYYYKGNDLVAITFAKDPRGFHAVRVFNAHKYGKIGENEVFAKSMREWKDFLGEEEHSIHNIRKHLKVAIGMFAGYYDRNPKGKKALALMRQAHDLIK
nr:hypothetical protein 14 [Legionellales bacterium]